VERAAFWLETTKAHVDRSLKLDIPRRAEDVKDGATRSALTLAKTREDLPRRLRTMKLELAKKKYDRAKADRHLRELKQDRGAMTVRAPADGVVYYGRCVRGAWPKTDPITAALAQGGGVKPHVVLVTLVRPRPLAVRVTLPEKHLRQVPVGCKARVAPAAAPERWLDAAVDEISHVPVPPGGFAARLAVTPAAEDAWWRAGMSCQVKVQPARPVEAPAVPSKAVLADPADPKKRCVYVRKADGAGEKRTVTVGRTSDGMTEIRQGVKEGEVVFLKAPKGGE
jgi:multidrug efflux pump subunit AcrA (membrane-fusion protein)